MFDFIIDYRFDQMAGKKIIKYILFLSNEMWMYAMYAYMKERENLPLSLSAVVLEKWKQFPTIEFAECMLQCLWCVFFKLFNSLWLAT